MSRASNNVLLAAAAALFAALAGLVAAGAASGFDQWACDHLMPFAAAPGPPPAFLESLVPLYHASWQPAGVALAQVVTLPGQVVVSFLLVLAGAWKLREPRWLVLWIAAVGVEMLCKHLITRPALYRGGVHVTGFDSSWPSGHALRCILVAVVLATAWPRLRGPLAAWLAAAVVLLELAGFHTPTDLAGGLLLGLLGWGAARAARLREA